MYIAIYVFVLWLCLHWYLHIFIMYTHVLALHCTLLWYISYDIITIMNAITTHTNYTFTYFRIIATIIIMITVKKELLPHDIESQSCLERWLYSSWNHMILSVHDQLSPVIDPATITDHMISQSTQLIRWRNHMTRHMFLQQCNSQLICAHKFYMYFYWISTIPSTPGKSIFINHCPISNQQKLLVWLVP